MSGSRSRSARLLRIAAPALLAALALVAFLTIRMRATSPAVFPATTAPSGESGNEMLSELDSKNEPDLPSPAEVETRSAVAADPAPKSASLPKHVRLVGDVRDRRDRLVATTSFLDLDTENGRKTVVLVQGHYAVEGLDPGPVSLLCQVEGYLSQWRPIDLRPGEAEHREDFVLDTPWELDVRALASDGRDLSVGDTLREVFGGTPLELRVSRDPPPDRWDRDGLQARVALRNAHFQTRFPRTGAIARLVPLIQPPYFVSGDVAGTVLASARVEGRVEEAVLRIPLDRAAGLRSAFVCRVADAVSKAPIAGARGHLVALDTGRDGPRIDDLVTDAAGEVHGNDLPLGRFLLEFDADDRLAPSRTMELLPGRTTDVGTFELEACVEVAGRCVDLAGNPVPAKFRLIPHRPNGSLDPSLTWECVDLSSGSDGSFRKSPVMRCEYVVRSGEPLVQRGSTELRPRPLVVDLRTGPVEGLVVTFEPVQTVALKARSPEVRPFVYRILSREGAECDRGELWLPKAQKIGLVPGEYRVLVGPDDAHLRTIPFTVGTQPVTIPIED